MIPLKIRRSKDPRSNSKPKAFGWQPFHEVGEMRPAMHSCDNTGMLLSHLAKLCTEEPSLLVVLWLRVSTKRQSVESQRKELLKHVSMLRCRVLKIFTHVGSGWDLQNSTLREAIDFARMKGAVLVALSADRFLRSRGDTKAETINRSPSPEEWQTLAEIAKGVRLATVIDPETPYSEVIGERSKAGMQHSSSMSGRPRKSRPGAKKELRQRLLPRVLALRLIFGCSWRELIEQTGCKLATLQGWVSRGVRILKESPGKKLKLSERGWVFS